ncbi:PBP1A family penicillin-binding protein [Fodinisporobacter ferrooxydans]|uniref:PBP1A family penicillin-binding protein n=1 Tax=Fodinisporobacter ferrooxydans TaxID=2901836 RepID=A0ABY4CKI8_9BACL|nr:PBP1A family penicillin-binding protein [Alicyclobacillaceae bacterium MYW30-H2]
MWKHFIRAILVIVLLVGIVVVLVGGAIAIPKFDKSKLEFHSQPSTILDKNGNVAIKIDTGASDYVTFDQISSNMKHAIVATEDNRFYDHGGIDIRGIARALLVDIWHGGAAEGGSTITQQLAKMVYLNQSKTISRKIHEAILAAQIEHNFSKDEILEKYLNVVYLGDGQTGVQDAAKDYFGVSAKDLTLDQAAVLAGLPKAPSYYDPFVNPKAALDRRNTVLDLMYKYGYITDQQRQQAEAQPLGLRKKTGQGNNNATTNYGYYLDYILEEAKADGIDPQQILRGGVTVYTNMDQAMQASAEKAYQNNANFPKSASDQLIQSGAVFVDPKSGGILAIVGARGAFHQEGFDYATMSRRSPGSAIKPLVDYGPAIDLGLLSPNDMLVDKPMTFGNGYRPHDWDNWTVHKPGMVTVREALRESWNVPAVWTMDHILGGPEKGIAFAKRLGLTFDPSDDNLSVAIGGMKYGVSPLQMAQAYSPFDNSGILNKAHAIEKVVNSTGDVLYQFQPNPTRVMKSSTAAVMTDLMTTVVKSGTGVRAQIPGVPVAGKTGTSEYNYNGDRDAWFVGYTPQVVGAIWMGYPNTDAKHYMTGESGYPAGIFSTILAPVIKGQNQGQFPAAPQEQPVQQPPAAANQTLQLQGQWDPQSNSVTLTWNRLEQSGVQYSVFRKGTTQAIGTINAPMFIDRNPPLNQDVVYIVVATIGNKNIQSNTVDVKTDQPAAQNPSSQQPAGNLPGNSNGNTPAGDQQSQPGGSSLQPGGSSEPPQQNSTGNTNVGNTGTGNTNTNLPKSGDTGSQGAVLPPSGNLQTPPATNTEGKKKP